MTADKVLPQITDAAEMMRKYRAYEAAAREDLRLIVRHAVDSGIPITQITKAAGWSQRASVYNLLKG